MFTIKKREPIETLTPGVFYAVMATPADSLKGENKNFYIVNVIDRRPVDGRAYSVETKVCDMMELREVFGLKKREYVEIIA